MTYRIVNSIKIILSGNNVSINFINIDKIDKNMAYWADEAEAFVYSKPRYCAHCCGLIIEKLILLIYETYNIEKPKRFNLHKLIYKLKDIELISEDYFIFLIRCKDLRNNANHPNSELEINDSIEILYDTFIFYKYFCDICSKEPIIFNNFVIPKIKIQSKSLYSKLKNNVINNIYKFKEYTPIYLGGLLFFGPVGVVIAKKFINLKELQDKAKTFYSHNNLFLDFCKK